MNKKIPSSIVISLIIYMFLTFIVIKEYTWFHNLDTLIYQLHWEPSEGLISLISIVAKTATIIPIFLISLFISLFFLWKKNKLLAFWTISNVLIVSFLGILFKYSIARVRPEVEQLAEKTTYSFPSGHSLLAMCLVCSIFIILKQENKHYLFIKISLIIYLFLIGASRIILRVHYPSDVLGGFLLSYIWVSVSYFFVQNHCFSKRLGSKAINKHKLFLILFSIGTLAFITASVYGLSTFKSLKKATDSMYQPLDRESVPITNKSVKPISVLLLGIANDSNRQHDYRANTIMIVTLNNDTEKTTITSIPRDAYLEIIGKEGLVDKINHAHSFGGEIMMIDTIEDYFNIPINHYFSINMDGLSDLVNAIGGLTVDNQFEFEAEGIHYPKGEIFLNGWETLQYVRMRNEDPLGDYGRQRRQREVITLLIDQLLSLNNLLNYQELLAVAGDNAKTDMTLSQLTTVITNYNSALKTIETDQIQGLDYIGDGYTGQEGISYQIIPEEERQRVKDNFSKQLLLE